MNLEEIFEVAYEQNHNGSWVFAKSQQLGLIKSCDDLLKIQEFANYKKGWVYHKCIELGFDYPSNK